jgi:CRISPR-associated protein Cas1
MARNVAQVNPEAKRAFAGLIAVDLPGENGTTTVTGAANRLAQSLSRCFETGKTVDLALPRLPGPIEIAGLSGLLT